eukprot:4228881-Amphidinium_carterae.1
MTTIHRGLALQAHSKSAILPCVRHNLDERAERAGIPSDLSGIHSELTGVHSELTGVSPELTGAGSDLTG